ncbi:hypothetical protein HKX48_008979 [Thoreauomyces humboldtii]|nr:hypothetical protein HKX48_008979 [Thoreauomyces humboldtii]
MTTNNLLNLLSVEFDEGSDSDDEDFGPLPSDDDPASSDSDSESDAGGPPSSPEESQAPTKKRPHDSPSSEDNKRRKIEETDVAVAAPQLFSMKAAENPTFKFPIFSSEYNNHAIQRSQSLQQATHCHALSHERRQRLENVYLTRKAQRDNRKATIRSIEEQTDVAASLLIGVRNALCERFSQLRDDMDIVPHHDDHNDGMKTPPPPLPHATQTPPSPDSVSLSQRLADLIARKPKRMHATQLKVFLTDMAARMGVRH